MILDLNVKNNIQVYENEINLKKIINKTVIFVKQFY